MIFDENRLLADDSHVISYLIFVENWEQPDMSKHFATWEISDLVRNPVYTISDHIITNQG